MITTYFGSPGCGKTTLAIKLAKKHQKDYAYTFLNFEHTVDKNTQQIIDGYKMPSMLWLLIWFLQLDKGLFAPKFKLTFRPFYYKYFDSYSKDDIPVNYHKKVGESRT